MDAFDGDSDLSDISAPPTPGPAATPRAASPETSSAVESVNSEAPTPTTTDSPRSSIGRRTSRRVAEAVAEASSPIQLEPTSRRRASNSSNPKSLATSQTAETPALTRRATTRDRKVLAKLRSPSPSVERFSPITKSINVASTSSSAANTPKGARLKVKLNVKARSSADGDSESSRGVTPQPGTASTLGTKVTVKAGSLKRLADDLRDLADDDSVVEEEARSEDEFVPDEGAAEKPSHGKRGRNERNKTVGRRRAVVADDEDDEAEEQAPKAPQRKRARLSDRPASGAKAKARSARRGKKAFNFSDDDDEDEKMIDAATDEGDLVDDAAAVMDDEFDEDDGPSRGSKARKGRSAPETTKKAGGRPSATATKSSVSSGAKKTAGTASTSGIPSNASSKVMSAEARMRASIDAAKDKSLKPPGVSATAASKLNPQASAFRPSSTIKSGPGGASTPTGAGRPGTAGTNPTSASGTGVKRGPSTGAKPAFGKSMSGWDQLFGGISGLSTSSTPNKATQTKAVGANKPSTPATPVAGASGTGIRPDPVLESASLDDVQRLREQATQEHLNTDECFDLLAHADIMLAFERSVYLEDRKLAAKLRPAFWKAGQALQPKTQGQAGTQTQKASPTT